MSVFARLAPRLQEAIVARLGWSSLRPVQELAGEALLAGENAVILAPTAGGKTEAAIFPTLSGLVADAPEGVGALYIAPIKALLNNQAERLGLYTEMVGLRRFVWHGDVPDPERKRFLREPAELLMTTPESLEVMLVSQRVDAASLFADLRTVIIDEVHALAGSDRGAHLASVIERLARLSRHDLQRVGLSATVGNPDTILAWLHGSSHRERRVVAAPKEPSKRQVSVTLRADLPDVVREAARRTRGKKSLYFCQSRATAEAVADGIREHGTEVFVHHSAVSREERALAEERFHHGTEACIVCTSTLELGIDVGDLDQVLQAEAPDTVSSFLQRMGRTGRRAGQSANTTFLCESTEGVLQAAAIVELAKSGWVESVRIDDRCWPVMIHQLLALALAGDGVTPEDAWSQLSVVSDFKGIARAEYDLLVTSLVAGGALRLAGGLLVLGPVAERRFGRRNFMELFAVFTSPQSYSVETASERKLGTLNQDFVDDLVEGMSSFLLGGRAWSVVQVRHDDRRIVVEPAPRGRRPSWGGYLPRFLGFEICQRILVQVLSDQEPLYLEPDARAALVQHKADLRQFIDSPRGAVIVKDGEIEWWTFAGGRINSTLRHALEALNGAWSVVPDNLVIRISGQGIDLAQFATVRVSLEQEAIWNDVPFWSGISRALPSYRLSKFQPLMPDWVEREVLTKFLLDVDGAKRWVLGTNAS